MAARSSQGVGDLPPRGVRPRHPPIPSGTGPAAAKPAQDTIRGRSSRALSLRWSVHRCRKDRCCLSPAKQKIPVARANVTVRYLAEAPEMSDTVLSFMDFFWIWFVVLSAIGGARSHTLETRAPHEHTE